MKKSRLLCGVIATMSLGTIGASTGAIKATEALEPDTRVIVKLKKDIDELTSEEALNQQENLLSRIRYSVNPKAELVNRFTVLNNAMTLKVNEEDVAKIENLSGVEHVYKDNFVVRKNKGQGVTYQVNRSASEEIDQNENVSARTMRMPGFDDGTGNILPGSTYEGEGTVIAILDNEFYFRGKVNGEPEWHHEVFDALDDSVKVRFAPKFVDRPSLKNKLNASMDFSKSSPTTRPGLKTDKPGEEGSLYFNSKVPFYFDYGGSTLTGNSTDAKPDFDVHSDIDYHGSHVASITAANAPEYKGIAPKAQLACMRVFTEYRADDISKDLGLSDSDGAYDSCILMALEDCITLGVDGINMSLGSDLGEFEDDDLAMQTIEKIVSEEKILTSISNGNAGKESYAFAGGYGNWTNEMVETGILGSYANHPTSMSIGSAHPDYIYYKTGIKCGETNIAYDDQIVNNERYPSEYDTEYKMRDIVSSLEDEVEWAYIPGFGTANDYSGIDIEGKVAVVNRGSISFADKYNTAADKGAIGLFIINNDPTETDFTFRCSFGDDFNPTMPCAVVLFKDKPFFEKERTGLFTFIEKELSKDSAARTMSTFSTDGARSDLDIKPEITAPGDIIRGAVPPQTKEDKQLTPLTTYEYLSGTSMSAPNYAGAQAVVLSKVSGPLIADGSLSKDDLAAIKEERGKVNMRLMSTANPMDIVEPNPETNVKNYASPRVQGAGMADIYGALNSKVYLEGFKVVDGEEKGLGKAKIELHNNDDINNGNLKLSFYAHNESEETLDYKVKLTVMRPAQAENNKIITSDYNYLGEVDSFEKLPGIQYYDYSYKKVVYTSGTASYKDVYKVTKQLTYYKTEADYKSKTNPVIIEPDTYYVSSQVKDAQEGVVYESLPNHKYLSTKDVVLDVIEGQKISIAPGDSKITINPYSLSKADKEKILEMYPYGTYIEGYCELIADGFEEDLNIPFLGFYGGGDIKAGQNYNSAPVVEEFQFEKNPGQVYPSDLVNDTAKQLVGKDNADMGSLWVAGYAKSPDSIATDQILKNDRNITQLNGFYPVGTDPLTLSDEGAIDNIYVGNAEKTNTMIIQQFVLRSVRNNFFTIKNKADGKVVYKSALEDMLFGPTNNEYNLYKSHVEGGYLGAGYVAHRAWAVVPLYDEVTQERFADGEYEVTFNYQINGTGEWVKKSYTLHIDNTPAEVSKVYEENGKVRIEIKDQALSYVTVGYTNLPVSYDEAKGVYYVEVEPSFIDSSMKELGRRQDGTYRLYIRPVDKAFGESGAVIHFTKEGSYDDFEIVQNRYLKSNHDFKLGEDGKVQFIEIDQYGNEKVVTLGSEVSVATGAKPDRGGDLAIGIGVPAAVGVAVLAVGCIAIVKALGKKRPKKH